MRGMEARHDKGSHSGPGFVRHRRGARCGRFGDTGANTLGHIAEHRARAGKSLRLPNLTRLGLMHAARESAGQFPAGSRTDAELIGAYGYAEELSTGKDTPSGHWEMAGVPVLYEWGYFTRSRPTHSRRPSWRS